jgi:hypothetical protein
MLPHMFSSLRSAQCLLGDFLVPWEIAIGTIGFLAAWIILVLIEQLGWTRYIWNIPLLFVALAILFYSTLGICFAP